ncbi:hypothetical protein PGB90_001572 [Kerria lacca]
MHFSIPEIKEVKEGKGSSYMVYNIYINGIFHCNVRYSQLYILNESLKEVHGSQNLPYFPPKKFFTLTKCQLEERQYYLEKYLQTISQKNELVYSSILRRFLFLSQQKSASNYHCENDLIIWLLNGTQISIKVSLDDNSECVLQKVCDHLRIPQEVVHYFSLFVQRQYENGEYQLIHCLQDYECPMLTLRNLYGQNKIVIRKSYWDSALDLKLMLDRSTLNLLYAQTVSDIERGWIITNKDVEEQLAILQSRGAKREYLEIARTLTYYGYIRFDGCTSDYPEPGIETVVSIGQKDLIFSPKSDYVSEREKKFRITRIRCWKIIPLSEFNNEVQLSFEYLINSNKLQWITIISEYVFLLSVCLQASVDELMLKKTGNLKNTVQKSKSKEVAGHNNLKKHLSSQLYFVPLLENDSFENIGDDDL